MKISLRFIGQTIVEITISDLGTIMTTDIANVDGIIDIEFIQELEDVLKELKAHNNHANSNLIKTR